MKKVSVREFQRHFGKLSTSLKPGESLLVTRNGKEDGVYQKIPARKIAFSDYKERLKRHDYAVEVGEELLRQLL